jgi:hypothetical protein
MYPVCTYVVTNKEEERYENRRLYAHVECQEKHAKPN